MPHSLPRVLASIVVASLVAAASFHGLVRALSGESSSGAVGLLATLGVIILQALFALVIGLVIGLPAYFVARRYGLANLISATAVGLIVGVAVSAIYGDLDLQSLSALGKSFAIFGIPGMLGGATFWLLAHAMGAGVKS